MKATEFTCYGCKGGDGEPLRIKVFGNLEACPTCGRPFHSRGKIPCVQCKALTAVRGGICESCAEKDNHG